MKMKVMMEIMMEDRVCVSVLGFLGPEKHEEDGQEEGNDDGR